MSRTPHLKFPQAIFDSNDAHEAPMAEPWQANLTSFQKLLFLRWVGARRVQCVAL